MTTSQVLPANALGLSAGTGVEIISGGVDVTDTARLAASWRRVGPMFLDRIATPTERREVKMAPDPSDALAVLFGVKEAVIKAVGGMPSGGRFTDIEVATLVGAPDGTTTGDVVVGGAVGVSMGAMMSCRGGRLLAGTMALSSECRLGWVLVLSNTGRPR